MNVKLLSTFSNDSFLYFEVITQSKSVGSFTSISTLYQFSIVAKASRTEVLSKRSVLDFHSMYFSTSTCWVVIFFNSCEIKACSLGTSATVWPAGRETFTLPSTSVMAVVSGVTKTLNDVPITVVLAYLVCTMKGREGLGLTSK